jgi:hypothetical protein
VGRQLGARGGYGGKRVKRLLGYGAPQGRGMRWTRVGGSWTRAFAWAARETAMEGGRKGFVLAVQVGSLAVAVEVWVTRGTWSEGCI